MGDLKRFFEKRSRVRRKDQSCSNPKLPIEKKEQEQGGSELYTASALYLAIMESQQERGKNVPICLFCDKSHACLECFKAQKLPLEERKVKDMNTEDIIKYFNETISINENVRYEVHLPWTADHSELSSKEHLAEIRLLSTTKKLLHLQEFEAYEQVLTEWEKLGIIEEIREEEGNDNLKDTAENLKESFYVDNCITSFNNEQDSEKFVRESKELMSSGNFNLRDWVSNIDNGFVEKNEISVLGMLWNKRDDIVSCDLGAFSKLQNIPETRRGLLSVAQWIFDPIGFTCTFTLIPKILLQDTWQLKTGWDSELPEILIKRFNTWLRQTQFLSLCKVHSASENN
ncbi:hypothetical protein JTB14_028689 [Gonioctena quinquepunctata]|nr:hypothetical protein JTB14_028689 [Gonioctena quinquepunctata]